MKEHLDSVDDSKVMKVQGRRRRERPRRRWLDKVKNDIKEKGLSADDVYDRATWRRTSTPPKSGNKMKERRSRMIST